ncbi:MAG: hypothetical protein EOO73_35530 [Myxococcales bacterium]|nr:MAG: hypothetical protein EOO73_35530 [Myxococcales bacterium]
MASSGLVRAGLAACWLSAASCRPAPSPPEPRATPVATAPKPSAPRAPQLAEEPEPGPPELRTGRIQPLEHSDVLTLSARRHGLDGDEQLLEIVLPDFAAEVPGDSFWLETEARISGSSAPFQLVSRGKNAEMVLWLRRAKADLAAEIAGDAYTPSIGAQPGHHFRFRVPAPRGAPSPELAGEWAAESVKYLNGLATPFGLFAGARLQARYRLPGEPSRNFASGGSGDDSLVDLMDTFAGRAAVQAALATRRSSISSAAKQPRVVPIAQLKVPQLSRHPWAALSKRLGKSAPPEPLADAVPASFYFVRAKSFSAFSDMLSFVQDFGAPAADLVDGTRTQRGTLPRYLAELGVEAGELSRVLGPEVVQDFALTGSDPYLHEGSDVTLVFRLKSPLLFRAALLKALDAHGAAHGGTQRSSFVHEGVTVEVTRSADGRVRQHHASVGELELVSNSPAAIKRVIATTLGKAPSLARQEDFQYMLARDAEVPSDVLAFIGDLFVETVVGPAQKIAAARRQVALAELVAPSSAALLYGWVHGKSPRDRRELLQSGLLSPLDSKHTDGARIDWEPGRSPRSPWGTPAALEPLLDLPPVSKVSAAERDSYEALARSYEARWSQYIDPIAVRLSATRSGGAKGLHAELRVLPFAPRDEAARFDLGGNGRVAPVELPSGARLSLGIGEDSPLRRELSGALELFSRRGIALDWLGDYAMVGVLDRTELLAAARLGQGQSQRALERPPSPEEMVREDSYRSELDLLPGLPLYAVVGLRSRVAAAVALTAARQMLEGAAAGAVQWQPFAAYRNVEVVRISGRDRGRELALYYALAGDDLVLSFNRTAMRTLIDRALDGKLVEPRRGGPAGTADGQVVLELAPSKKGALRTLLTWGLVMASAEGNRQARATAEAVLRGVPETAHQAERSGELSLAYLGVVPLTPDGRRYALTPTGIMDPLRGTAHAPLWPSVPTADSAAARLLAAFSRFRSDLSFDEEPRLSAAEPPLRSLRARVDLWLR